MSASIQAQTLPEWLEQLEQMHPQKIDLGLDRVRAVAANLGLDSSAIKIVVAGTNGKGSTCAMLEAILLSAGYRVGVYTSPHLIHFNERARINGESATDAQFLQAFEVVEKARGDTSLTYFEFTTLAILWLFAQESLDAWVLEVGLGGRLDAVNLVDADCAIVTSIDIDHTDWLGADRETIGLEKAHVFRPGKPAICADPQPPESVIEYAKSIGADLWVQGQDFNYSGDRQQWAFAARGRRRNALGYPGLRGANQLLNASGALAAIEALRDQLMVPQQAVRLGLLQAKVPGRFQFLPGQPAIVLDVAHNPHAAAVLDKNLAGMGFFPYTYAVFGILGDKDIEQVVHTLSKRFDAWYCATLPGERGLSGQALKERVEAQLALDFADKPNEPVPEVLIFDSPAQAFEAASQKVTVNDRIVAFGSFITVGEVLVHLGRD
ncbi:bifunctional tetrahydrofolate synthase/dihydrofolate synthase [Orrella sp. 11846]|uniref:bifunctional tetrahydrofolate synthase/dihydrofolate synthase n=1 Tax=Orrella sp. 11846 TaxID=3409913 RepID=UPI003B5A3040